MLTSFDPGEFVKRKDAIGLVLETKVRYLQEYCRILWVGSDVPEWVHVNQLYEYCVEKNKKEKNYG